MTRRLELVKAPPPRTPKLSWSAMKVTHWARCGKFLLSVSPDGKADAKLYLARIETLSLEQHGLRSVDEAKLWAEDALRAVMLDGLRRLGMPPPKKG